MQLATVRKKVGVEAGIMVVVALVLGGSAYFLADQYEAYKKEISQIESNTAQLVNQATRLREQFVKVQQNAELYEEALDKIVAKQLSIEDQKIARAKFEEIIYRYLLSNVRLTMSNPETIAGHNYKDKTDMIEQSTATIQLEALTDEDVYNVLYAMHSELPGMIKITSVKIVRKARPDELVLRSMVDSGTPPLVEATIGFTWYGLKDLGLVSAHLQDVQGRDYASMH